MKRLLSLSVALTAACGAPKLTPAPDSASKTGAAASSPKLSRDRFNSGAQLLNLPLFWTEDIDGDGLPGAAELAVEVTANWADYVKDGALTAAGKAAVEAVLAGPPEVTDARAKLVQEELLGGRRTLVLTDLRVGNAADRAVVKHIAAAAKLVEALHARQLGVFALGPKIPKTDLASQALFARNQGPWCVKAALEANPLCSALPEKPAKISGLYPAGIQADPKFCETLGKRKDRKALMDPFVVVTERDGELHPTPYTEHYATQMAVVAIELRAAAKALPPEEAAFKAYLEAAAQAFGDNKWFAADEKWAAMNAQNSKWYLRVGPDETYFEPCNEKAGFHVSFARINQGSLVWQRKLDPLKQEMEHAVAHLAGAPYTARKVSFQLPDFIDIILNAGDARSAIGATIGQSLPNWGPVANEGRGRTVAMTNLYEDPDSKASLRKRVESVFCDEAMASYTDDSMPGILSTVLHEAAHNLGPSAEYAVKGKTDREIFGGPLAATLEEFKAQMASLYFSDWLVEKGVLTRTFADQAHTNDVVWSFGQIARGMYTAEGRTNPYPQLSAIMTGTLLEAGAIEWHEERKAHNGVDKGCFSIHLDRFPAVGKTLLTQGAGIKGRGDKAAAEALKARFVDADGKWKTLRGVIKARWSRAPKTSFVYAIKY